MQRLARRIPVEGKNPLGVTTRSVGVDLPQGRCDLRGINARDCLEANLDLELTTSFQATSTAIRPNFAAGHVMGSRLVYPVAKRECRALQHDSQISQTCNGTPAPTSRFSNTQLPGTHQLHRGRSWRPLPTLNVLLLIFEDIRGLSRLCCTCEPFTEGLRVSPREASDGRRPIR